MYDVIIVGAGPAGLYTAGLLEKKLKVLVIDKKKEIGLPVQCSGLYSTNLEKFVPIKKAFLQHRVKGAILHSPLGTDIRLQKKGTAAYVIDREKFDKYLAAQVKSEMILGNGVKSIEIKKDKAIVNIGKGKIECKMILGCDGPSSVVRNHFREKPSKIINGLIATLPERNYSEYVELWFDSEKVPGGFFWKIPRGKSTEYGVFAKNVNFIQLENFFSIKKAYKKNAGTIPFGPSKTYFPRCLSIGDAAAHVKPWSGGGVVYGLTCAKIAADVVFKAFKKNDFSEDFLKQYEIKWKKVLGKNITLGIMFRDFLEHANNKDLEKFFSNLKETKKMNDLDMDFPEWGFEF